ncbi:MAG: saccharopine dehydrogenase C-terminal domain-containing protein [Candidatus Poseidoniia archaeon]|jgi:saccharopine dehydrogenase-like NADP-dependent oxidoreductase|nr:saccharopine dehydrogenase C-terminal domain-containing protein [Candidatus Poseidoniia archaeon]MDP6592037.1 saccharopine dehydrogenase C-terminal domain-containing protein [Candidatus Poseidoniia archaeon]MDP7096231.1 saccharopine dehydrogenase C-terminal domain-containing protein [Candidatus Poseidoniia archaeon]MDP7445048.1 saccharopine dehydrogenase C-terminal domain-containing protein [Candidatus Poseidoniia archaeon]MDP7665697.1 saccharopine dehydrogenase C-terminal domain-containing |tara:strand:- start:23273 stop:24379 length:1107 start_codon:yes stop_codon:yes gene_type:complete
MKIAVIGGGMIGSFIAEELCNDFEVMVVDNNKSTLNQIEKRNHRISAINFDVKNGIIEDIIANYDLAVNCLPGFMGFEMLKKIIQCKVSCVDISFMPENCLELSEFALENNCLVIPDAGVAPGLSNLIIGNIVANNKIEEIQTMVGGLPKKKNPPWNYKAPFSPIDVIEEYTRPARIRINGKTEVREALSKKLRLEVEGIGELEAFLTDGLRTLLDSKGSLSEVPNLMEFTIRYPGHCDLIRKMISDGKFSNANVKGKKITRKEETSGELFESWKLEEGEEEFTFMLILAVPSEGNEISYTIYDEFTEGATSMARTTGLTACAFSRLVLENKIKEKGVICPETLGMNNIFYDYVLNYLRDRGILIESW